jgi:plasmid stability protein
MRYTLRGIPKEVDDSLRQRAKREGKSLNQIAIEALKRGVALDPTRPKFHDLDFAIGTWVEDPEFDKIIEEQRQIDPDMWK